MQTAFFRRQTETQPRRGTLPSLRRCLAALKPTTQVSPSALPRPSTMACDRAWELAEILDRQLESEGLGRLLPVASSEVIDDWFRSAPDLPPMLSELLGTVQLLLAEESSASVKLVSFSTFRRAYRAQVRRGGAA